MWYLAPEEAITQFNPDKPATVGALSFITSFVLYGYLIPISLYVSIEIVKLAQVYFIMSDKAMYHEETDQYALARTSNLNEELGMIQVGAGYSATHVSLRLIGVWFRRGSGRCC